MRLRASSIRSGFSILATLALVLSYQNCSKTSFEAANSSARDKLLAGSRVLIDDGSADGRIPTGGGADGRIPTRGGGSGDGSIPTTDIPVGYECSDRVSHEVGYNLKSVTDVKIQLANSSGEIVCEVSGPQIRERLLNEKILDLKAIDTQCPNLADGKYELRLVMSDSAGNTFTRNPESEYFSSRGATDLIDDSKGGKKYVTISSSAGVKRASIPGASVQTLKQRKDQQKSGGNPGIMVLYDINPRSGGDTVRCDWPHSPLIIQLSGSGAKSILLSAPLDGILFDILGKNAHPVAHTKSQISWLLPQTAKENFFIVLPDAQGRVNGIEEMFGNNTSGPDGKFAANGYEALRKYDGRKSNDYIDRDARNGRIDRRDEVFRSLRLWSDVNVDGVAQASELFSLDDKKIESIDLKFDPRFSESDKYGNEVKMKSVAKTRDGKLHLVFDLWFRAL